MSAVVLSFLLTNMPLVFIAIHQQAIANMPLHAGGAMLVDGKANWWHKPPGWCTNEDLQGQSPHCPC